METERDPFDVQVSVPVGLTIAVIFWVVTIAIMYIAKS